MDSLEGLLRRINKLEATIERLQKLETRRIIMLSLPARIYNTTPIAANTVTNILCEGALGLGGSSVTIPSNVSGVFGEFFALPQAGAALGALFASSGDTSPDGLTTFLVYAANGNASGLNTWGTFGIIKTGIATAGANLGKKSISIKNSTGPIGLVFDLYGYTI